MRDKMEAQLNTADYNAPDHQQVPNEPLDDVNMQQE
jgi:hypothetical protein